MKITMTLIHRGDSVTVTTAPVDIIGFERAYGMGFGKAFTKVDDLHLEYQLWLAWHACKRTGGTSEDFESWLGGVDEIVNDEEAVPGPLDETQTPTTG